MARARNIKPGFYKNEDLADCSVWARLIFPGLWMLADREGRLEDRPKRIKGELLPYDSVEVEPLLCELAQYNFIVRYVVDGQRYIQITKFLEHQAPHVREQASSIPGMPVQVESTAKVVPCTDLGSDLSSPGSPDSLNPSSLNPLSPIPLPDSGIEDSDSPSVRRLRVAKNPATAPETGELWNSYSTAYQGRYGAPPVRNAKVNAQLANLIKRLGSDEAPGVAAWYVSSNNRYYVQKRHAVDCLLADAEGLRTEWATRRRVTETGAREADRLQTSGDMWGRIMEQAQAEQENGGH